jgi:hypothetical protein
VDVAALEALIQGGETYTAEFYSNLSLVTRAIRTIYGF